MTTPKQGNKVFVHLPTERLQQTFAGKVFSSVFYFLQLPATTVFIELKLHLHAVAQSLQE